MQEALQYCQSGELEKAKKLYLQIIDDIQNHPGALANLGTIELQLGNSIQGISYLEKSIQIDSNQSFVLSNLANGYMELHRYEDAINLFDKALEVDPTYAEAFYNRGIAFKALKRFDDAIKSYSSALQIIPNYLMAINNRALIFHQLERFDEALGDYDYAIHFKSDIPEIYNNRGMTLFSSKRFEEALNDFDRAIHLKPDYAEAYLGKGSALHELKRFEEALNDFDRAIHLKPDYAEAYLGKGSALHELKRFEEALNDFDRAIHLKPDYAEAYLGKGSTLYSLDLNEEALIEYDCALAIDPFYANALINRGAVYFEIKNFKKALNDFDQAIILKPDLPKPKLNKAFLLLLLGQYEEGWNLYEWRSNGNIRKKNYKEYPQPVWMGRHSIKGKTLLLRTEQGLGDTIQFSRYLPMLDAEGIQVILETPKVLLSILKTMKGHFNFIEKDTFIPHFDFHCSIMSLPFVFNTTLEKIPASIPYFETPADKKILWKNKLGPKTKPRIGLVWAGSTSHKRYQKRNLTLQQIQPLLNMPFEFHVLQKEIREIDKSVLNNYDHIFQHQESLKDFSDTAALIEEMDLIISVDTSVAHLAGALGKSLWILLPFLSDFRWLEDRQDSPWYPSAKLFRQSQAGNWSEVITQVTKSIHLFF